MQYYLEQVQTICIFRGIVMLSQEEQPFAIFKICLIGQGGVGKTCIANRLCFDTFDLNTKLTIGINFYSYKIPILVGEGDESFVTLSLWDFGGQEQFKRLFPYYINGANAILAIFSVVDMQTLIGLDWWYKHLFNHNHRETPRILIGSKQDLVGNKAKSPVDDLVIKRFMDRHKETNFERTSSKDNVNITKIFRDMAERLLKLNDFEYLRLL